MVKGAYPKKLSRIMSSQILKLLAAFMLIGSLVLIAIAYRLSSPPIAKPASPATEAEQKYQIVTANRNLHIGEIISESDVILISATNRQADTFDTPNDVLGKQLVNTILHGNAITHADLATGNPLVRSLAKNERAIAIKVDEFSGVGGFIQPGDSVDVVAFIRGDNQRIKDNLAIIALHNVRVLSYGEELSINKTDTTNTSIKGKTGRNTAVIAIDSEQTPLLALIANSAVLHLALRPTNADGSLLAYPIYLNELATPPQQERFISEQPQGPLVEIYHGTQLEEVQYP